MNKEIHYEGWLIKSPPTKRIWRARWRRRWFTLKQGEIPEQFCLEYYTDRNCRKLKGVIDLDQCEQVDCGLRLENRKQKFQYMFDIKTPRRTYYLAADTETDMRDWVNCICQVCHLHDTSQSKSNVSNIHNAEISQYNHKSEVNTSGPSDGVFSITGAVRFFSYDSVKKKAGSSQQRTQATFKSEGNYVNTESSSGELVQHDNLPLESESQSESVRAGSSSNRCSRKVPGNLIIDNAQLHCQLNVVEPSPSFSTSSGPYIPISECFSGSSKFLTESGNPTTPLNNLDPKFYETPRCHNNIGLNLTNDQSYSPKITNFGLQYTNAAKVSSGRSSPTDSESVFTDEDDWTHPIPSKDNLDRNMRPSESSVENETCVFTYSQRFSKALNECNTRKSMRKSTELDKVQQVNKKKSFCLDIKSNIKLSKEVPQSSDTENTSPAIGADDTFSYVTESYDITRSHILPYYNISLFIDQVSSPPADVVTESRLFPNSNFDKIDNNTGKTAKVHVNQSNFHCFTNATQKKTEGHIFRYDFVEQKDLPPVNRKLKPKTEDKPREETAVKSLSQMLSCSTDSLSSKLMTTSLQGSISGVTISLDVDKAISPPSIDRKLKPNVYKFSNVGPGSRRSGNPLSLVIPNESDTYLTETRTLPRHPRSNFATCMLGSSTVTGCNTSINRTISISNTKMLVGMTHIPASVPHLTTNEHKLQYFDLDVANPPSINRQSVSVGNLLTSGQNRFGALIEPSTRNSVKGSVVYNSVDFVKTEAFKRIREERKKENESTNK